jgi:8-oxo-dGTP pyrophosphatase MutT (NUDIX family)
MTRSEPVAAIPSATVLLLRDQAGRLEVLMTTRHDAAGFAAGAIVFPGGKLEAEDAALARFGRVGAAGDEAAALRAAAIRETFEECGILLARRRGEAALLPDAALREVTGGRVGSLLALAREAGLELADDLLVPFAHWVTPADRPKRFSVHFLLAPAPAGQVPLHDGREAVDAVWVVPEAILAEAEANRVKMVFATRMNLKKLARSRSVAEALDAARGETIVTVMPERGTGPDGPVIRIPLEAGYGVAEVSDIGIPRA